jgi:polyhydroxybutyrate depolymerase
MKAFLLFIFLIGNISIFAQTTTGSLIHDGINRSYRVFLPSGYNSTIKYPLVLNLHGNGSTASTQEMYSQMNSVADTAKFIIVYPNGISNTWNSGFGHVSTDDVGFISALIDKMISDYSINKSKIYTCGMSMGGFMSFRLACELPEKIAAIASITGLVANQVMTNCQTQIPVPTMFIHGTNDATVSYDGTEYYSSAEATKNWLIERNECSNEVSIYNFPDLVNEGSTVTKYTYSSCKNSNEVWFYRVENGGHTWPGAPEVSTLGNTNRDINANVEIWNFFSKFELPTSSGLKEQEKITQPISFPNPFHNQINLSFQGENDIQIIDISGKTFFKEFSSSKIISTENWPSGIYFLKLQNTQGKILNQKLVKVDH